jgi:hypothetical protein
VKGVREHVRAIAFPQRARQRMPLTSVANTNQISNDSFTNVAISITRPDLCQQ